MTVTINVADDLYQRAAEIAAQENVPVEELFTSAFEERLREFERLKQRASRGSREKFLAVLDKVPAVEPADYDRF